MRLSEIIAQAIVALRDDGVSEPTTDDIQRMISVIYGMEAEREDIAKVLSNPYFQAILASLLPEASERDVARQEQAEKDYRRALLKED